MTVPEKYIRQIEAMAINTTVAEVLELVLHRGIEDVREERQRQRDGRLKYSLVPPKINKDPA